MKKIIPKHFWKFFWDVDPQTLNAGNKSGYVITRLLDKGDAEAASWVVKNFPREEIRRVFSTSRDMSLKTANFWGVYLGIPKDKVLCFQEPYLKLRKSHWPY